VSTIDSGHYGDGVARRTKRLWTDEEKRSICFQTAAPGVSVAQVARRYAVNANLIFKWLRDPRYAPDPASAPPQPEEARFLPVEIVAEAGLPRQHLPPTTTSRSSWRAGIGCGSAAAMIPRRWRG
jgi:transposase